MILYQISALIIFIFFVFSCVIIAKIYGSIKLTKSRVIEDILCCLVIFSFLLAFNINFW